MSELFSNHPGTTLVGGISSTTRPVTFTIQSATGLPPSGNFRVLIDQELLLITSISGTTLTGSNVEGTAPTLHADGANVQHILSAGGLMQAIGDQIQTALVGVTLPVGAGVVYNGTQNPAGTFSGGSDNDYFLNTSTNQLFGPKVNGAWPTTPIPWASGSGSGSGAWVSEIPSGTLDGSNKTFTLTNAPTANSLSLYVNIPQIEGTDYTISGNTITFTKAPKSRDAGWFKARYQH